MHAIVLISGLSGLHFSVNLSIVHVSSEEFSLRLRVLIVDLLDHAVIWQLARRENTLADILSVVLHSLIQILSENDRFLGHNMPIIVPKDRV